MLENASVHETFESSDLGVMFSSSLNFNQHIENVCSKAKSLMFFLCKYLITKKPSVSDIGVQTVYIAYFELGLTSVVAIFSLLYFKT